MIEDFNSSCFFQKRLENLKLEKLQSFWQKYCLKQPQASKKFCHIIYFSCDYGSFERICTTLEMFLFAIQRRPAYFSTYSVTEIIAKQWFITKGYPKVKAIHTQSQRVINLHAYTVLFICLQNDNETYLMMCSLCYMEAYILNFSYFTLTEK